MEHNEENKLYLYIHLNLADNINEPIQTKNKHLTNVQMKIRIFVVVKLMWKINELMFFPSTFHRTWNCALVFSLFPPTFTKSTSAKIGQKTRVI